MARRVLDTWSMANAGAAPNHPTALAGHEWTARECPGCGARYPGNYVVCPLDATPLREIEHGSDPLIGKVLGECYEVVRVIGYGGMATVYEARHTRLPNKRYAVKLLLPEFAVKPELVIRFAREAETASRIEHPHIVEVYDVHRTTEGTPYIVCEYLEGKEFGDLLAHVGRLPPAMVVEIACQICEGLAAAHAAGVVHRDVKPENMFVTRDPNTNYVTSKLLDFGVALDRANRTRELFLVGDPRYVAPEQTEHGREVDGRADVYAAGMSLYEALTNRHPFADLLDRGAPLPVMLEAQRTRIPAPPSNFLSDELPPAVVCGLDVVVSKATAKDPDARFESARAMQTTLLEVLHNR